MAGELHYIDASGTERIVTNKDLFDAHTILYATSDDTPVALTIAASRIVGRKSSGNIVALTGAEVLAILTGQAAAAFDWNNQNLDNIKQVNLTDPTELTISSGAVTKTQGFHTVDTEGDASTDNLDTINGGNIGDEVSLTAANTAREVVVRNGQGNISLRQEDVWKSYTFISPVGSSGTYYVAGFYQSPAADANLDEGSLTVSFGTAIISYAAHAFLVAAAAGATDTGTVSIVVSGTSMDDQGNRAAADSETIVSDITAMSTNAYYETVKKWLGTITYTLTPAGGAATFNADFNYGITKYDDFGNRNFTLKDFEAVGRAGADDTGFNITLFYHSSAGWTYSAAAFSPGGTVIADMNTDHVTEVDLSNGECFAYKRDNLETTVNGAGSEGYIVKVITSANKAVEDMDVHVGAHAVAAHRHLDSTEQTAKFVYDGSNWLEI